LGNLTLTDNIHSKVKVLSNESFKYMNLEFFSLMLP